MPRISIIICLHFFVCHIFFLFSNTADSFESKQEKKKNAEKTKKCDYFIRINGDSEDLTVRCGR